MRAVLVLLLTACGGAQGPVASTPVDAENHPLPKDRQAEAPVCTEPSATVAAPNGKIPPPPDVAIPPPDSIVTPSGLAYRVLCPGQGSRPGPKDSATVHYTGWTTDGQMFDSSRTRGAPATFPLNAVIAGFSEVLQLMDVGAQVRVWIPEYLAYKGRPGTPQGTLVFDIELISIKPASRPVP